jgi:hypothetical protein
VGYKTIVDPPSGWQHGYPKALPDNWKEESFDLKQWFLDNGYPEKDIDFALKYSRYWTKNDD